MVTLGGNLGGLREVCEKRYYTWRQLILSFQAEDTIDSAFPPPTGTIAIAEKPASL